MSVLFNIASILLVLHSIECNEYKGFDDTVMFDLNWSADDSILEKHNNFESIFVTSANKEKYKCLIPSVDTKESEKDIPYTGPTPVDLIAPLFSTTTCSYRIESYWTYEVCHGNFIKQYHEEREGKIVKLQEYYLGKWDKTLTEKLRLKMEKEEMDDEKLKYKKIDGLNLAYLEVQMTDGTICDLNGEHRLTKVLYVCYQHGKNEIYSLKETSTCNYEIIILTSKLCEHPKYKPKDSDENVINCVALEGSPKTPKGLAEMEVSRLKVQKILDGALRMHLVTDTASPVKTAIDDNTILESLSKVIDTKLPTSIKDTTPVDDFLRGKHCLTGGTGWWKFELCYGQYARQFHEKEEIILGVFNEKAHKEWLEENPHKRPKPKDRVQINHFYIDGTVCDKTLKKRQTEVQLKCLENAASPASVSLYLQEPKTCQYILVVESPLICDILQRADNDGLIDLD